MNKFEKALSFAFILVFLVFTGYMVSHFPHFENMLVKDTAELQNGVTVEVNIDGAVKNKGVYIIGAGKTIYDALYMAGGVTNDADMSAINSDTVIFSDCNIYVPKWADNAVSSAKDIRFSSSAEYLKCNINTAAKEDLMSLKGIGEALAGGMKKAILYMNCLD